MDSRARFYPINFIPPLSDHKFLILAKWSANNAELAIWCEELWPCQKVMQLGGR